MKRLNKLKILAAFSIGLLLSAACSDEKSDYINLSSNSYTFDSKGKETLEINIDAGKAWSVEMSEEWILEKERDGNKIVIGVESSKSNTIRSAKISFISGEAKETFTVSQLGSNASFAMMDNNILVGVMSPNGKYVSAVRGAIVNGAYQYTPYYIATETGQRTEKKVLTTQHAMASAISDEGLLVLSDETSLNSQYYDANDELKKFPVPADFAQAVIEATSADGRICVGYARNIKEAKYYPIKWVDFQYELLELPATTLTGLEVEEGALARGCSADGSIIYGSVWDDFAAVYWKDGKVHYVSQDKINVHDIVINHGFGDMVQKVADRPIFTAAKDRISPNGKYMALEFVKVIAENKTEKAISSPGIFDIETGETFILTEIPTKFKDGTGMTVSDNGLLSFGCPAMGTTNGFLYNRQTGKTISAKEFIEQEYGFSISAEETIVNKITNDGKSILGSTVLAGGSIIQYWYLNISE